MVFGQANQVRVGPNVHVSQADAAYPMGEVLLTADPVDPNRLLGCGIVYETVEAAQMDCRLSFH